MKRGVGMGLPYATDLLGDLGQVSASQPQFPLLQSLITL